MGVLGGLWMCKDGFSGFVGRVVAEGVMQVVMVVCCMDN